MPHPRRGIHAVLVTRAAGPDGSARVLIQLPDGYILVQPADARTIAAMLVEVAGEIEGSTEILPSQDENDGHWYG
jgi:hypothetical protein